MLEVCRKERRQNLMPEHGLQSSRTSRRLHPGRVGSREQYVRRAGLQRATEDHLLDTDGVEHGENVRCPASRGCPEPHLRLDKLMPRLSQ